MLGALESYCTSEHQSICTNACLLVTCTNECVTVILLTNDTYCGSLYGRFAAQPSFAVSQVSPRYLLCAHVPANASSLETYLQFLTLAMKGILF